MHFELPQLLDPVDGLHSLDRPFSQQEINDVLKYLPVDRAPGPDGFNGMFFKKCWHIIQTDFMCLVSQFSAGD